MNEWNLLVLKIINKKQIKKRSKDKIQSLSIELWYNLWHLFICFYLSFLSFVDLNYAMLYFFLKAWLFSFFFTAYSYKYFLDKLRTLL